jgi:hypothetical protein
MSLASAIVLDSHAIASKTIGSPSEHHVVKESEGRYQRNGARTHGFRSCDRSRRFAARRTEPRRVCPECGHERRDCTSYGVGRWGDDNKGRRRTAALGGASPARSRVYLR